MAWMDELNCSLYSRLIESRTYTGYQCVTGFRVTAGVLLLFMLPLLAAQGYRSSNESTRAVEVQMRNVMYHFTADISVHIRALRGQVVSTKGELPVFDDKNSFILRISSAEIAISPASLSSVLNSYVFGTRDAPLKNISVQVESGRLKIKGKLHSKGDIPFETEGQLSASEEGKIRLHAEKVKALRLPVKGLMDLLGLQIAGLIKADKVQGLQVEKDDLILDPTKLLPPPHIAGQITAVRLENGEIIQVFGHRSASAEMHVPFRNYMAYLGNELRFGKLTMSDTDMVLVDMNPDDPFDFYLDHYKEQLVAGYTKETPTFGLQVFMRDYNKLPRREDTRRGANHTR
jgi:hypothetical protein